MLNRSAPLPLGFEVPNLGGNRLAKRLAAGKHVTLQKG